MIYRRDSKEKDLTKDNAHHETRILRTKMISQRVNDKEDNDLPKKLRFQGTLKL